MRQWDCAANEHGKSWVFLRESSVCRQGSLPSVVQMIEDQRRLPGLDTIEKLAAALGVSTAWLGFGIGPQNGRKSAIM